MLEQILFGARSVTWIDAMYVMVIASGIATLLNTGFLAFSLVLTRGEQPQRKEGRPAHLKL